MGGRRAIFYGDDEIYAFRQRLSRDYSNRNLIIFLYYPRNSVGCKIDNIPRASPPGWHSKSLIRNDPLGECAGYDLHNHRLSGSQTSSSKYNNYYHSSRAHIFNEMFRLSYFLTQWKFCL